MAVWLIRILVQKEPPQPDPVRFDDIRDNVWWAARIERLAKVGITLGCRTDPLRYCPQKPVTRGKMATFLAQATGIIDTLQPQPPTYKAVAPGGFHTWAINEAGSVNCWGNNT